MINKIFIKKNNNIIVLIIAILLGIPLFLISLNSELVVGDELWNFQNIVKMIDGRTMYVDCNIIITPIFYLIGYCFIKFITGTILGFRIYNVFIFLILLIGCYGIFKNLGFDKVKSFLYTIFIFLFVIPYISTGANYNVLAVSIYILGIVLFFYKTKIKYYSILQGIVIFICIFTKQNIGLYYLIANVLVEFIFYRKSAIKCLINEIVIVFIGLLISSILMFFNGCLEGFISYAFLGMKEFSTGNFNIQQGMELYFVVLLFVVIFSYVMCFIISKSDKNVSNDLKILCIFAIFLNFTAFPIINLYHSSFAILLNIVIYIYLFDYLLLNKVKNKKILFLICCIFYIGINIFGVICGYNASKNIQIKDKNNVYYGANMSKELNEKLVNITDYIKQKEKEGINVICISSDASLYMTYLHKNNNEFDLCFRGNLGYNGSKKIMDKIKSLKNTEILMNKEIFWQEISDVRLYVIHNYQKIGDIDDVYIFKAN